MTGHSANTAEQLSTTAALDLAQLSAVEIIGAHCADLMTAAAVKLGLYAEVEGDVDLAEARILITAVAALVDGAAPLLGGHHAAPLRAGVQTLQKAFRDASPHPDAPGEGPGEKKRQRS